MFTEEDWTNVESPKVLAYPRSKAEAERAAWKFVESIEEGGNKFKLTCLNPTLIVGPLLTNSEGTSSTVSTLIVKSTHENGIEIKPHEA